MPRTVYIVREMNVPRDGDPNDLASVWLCTGNWREYEQTGARIVARVPIVAAEQTAEQLRLFLMRLDVEVIVETTADD